MARTLFPRAACLLIEELENGFGDMVTCKGVLRSGDEEPYHNKLLEYVIDTYRKRSVGAIDLFLSGERNYFPATDNVLGIAFRATYLPLTMLQYNSSLCTCPAIGTLAWH